jgi:peptidoglycan DL-endopeptidase LytE
MMRRRIFVGMGLGVLFASLVLCTNAFAKETYQVQPGDTVTSIAAKTGVTTKALKAANHVKGSDIQAKQILTIPVQKIKKTARTKPSSLPHGQFYAVKKGDTLFSVAKKTGISVAEIRDLNHLRGNALKIGQKLALLKSPDRNPVSAGPAGQEKLAALSDIDEDEEMEADFLTPEEALAAIERRKSENVGLLGKWNNPDEPKLLVRVAMGFLGAPYRLGGSTVTGLDCSGFVKNIYKFFNIDLPRTAFEQSHVGMRVARDELSEGDLIFFNTRKTVGHVGIYIGNNQFVHAASRKRGVRVDNLDTPYFDRRYIRAVRLKENGDGL